MDDMNDGMEEMFKGMGMPFFKVYVLSSIVIML